MKGGIEMRVEIMNVTNNNEVVMWNKEKDITIKKKVSKEIADVYRKELKQVGVIKTILYEDEKERLIVPEGDLAEYKIVD